MSVQPQYSADTQTLVDFLKSLPGASGIRVLTAEEQKTVDPKTLSPAARRAILHSSNTSKNR